MKTLHIQSSVGSDGVLNLRVPVGLVNAGQLVDVTVEPVTGKQDGALDLNWREFLDLTYGSCARFGLQRQDQGIIEEREMIE